MRKYFSKDAYEEFAKRIISRNCNNNLLTSAVLYSKMLKNTEKAIECLLKVQVVDENRLRRAVNVIASSQPSEFERNLLKFLVFYRTAISLISNGDFETLKSKYDMYLSPDSSNQEYSQILEYLFKNGLHMLCLNLIKMKILYGEKVKRRINNE